jgi:Arc/MetJ family transcription regulator
MPERIGNMETKRDKLKQLNAEIAEDLRAAVKLRALLERRTARAVVEDALTAYLGAPALAVPATTQSA